MKVLHLVSSGGLFGIERVILTLASQNNGVDYWVGALNNQHNPHLEMIEEAKTSGLKTIVFDSRAQVDFRTIFSIRKFLKENNIDVLHTHNFKSNILGFLATRFFHTQWLVTNHGGWYIRDGKMRFYKIIDILVLKFAKIVFTVSQEIKDGMLRKGFKETHIHVIHNGINISQFKQQSNKGQLRKGWKVSDNETLLTIVGRLASEKGHEVLFKALTIVVPQHPFVKCLVVGDGPLKNELELMAKNFNLSDHIIFAGIRKDMPAVYTACDIMVNASFMEGLPMTVIEAMAARLPVIATSVGGTLQVIRHEKNGLLVDPDEPHAMAEAIIQLMKDSQKRQQLAQEAYINVNTSFSDQIMADRYKKFYEIALIEK